MKKEWFSSKELTAIDGLPSTTQGINCKAKMEKWQSRKRSGVQGRAVEYHIDSLPAFVKTSLKMQDNINYEKQNLEDRIKVWVSAYFALTCKEQEKVIAWLLRDGVKGLLAFICSNEQKKPH